MFDRLYIHPTGHISHVRESFGVQKEFELTFPVLAFQEGHKPVERGFVSVRFDWVKVDRIHGVCLLRGHDFVFQQVAEGYSGVLQPHCFCKLHHGLSCTSRGQEFWDVGDGQVWW